MSSNHHKFDEALRHKVAGYEMSPEGYVLEQIFSHEAMQARRRTRRRFFFILFFLLSGSSLTTMALVLNLDWLKGTTSRTETVIQQAQYAKPSSVTVLLTAEPAEEPVVVELLPLEPVAQPELRSEQTSEPAASTPIEAATPAPREHVIGYYLNSLGAELLAMPVAEQPEGTSTPPVWEVTTVEKPKNELHLGTHVIFSRTSIVNDRYFDSYEGTVLLPNTDFGVMFGATAGFDFRRTIGIETGVNFFSLQGQRYSGMIGGREFTQEVLLSYMNFPVYLKLKHQVAHGAVPVVLNALVGGHYGKLKAAEVSLDGAFMGTDVTPMIAQYEIAYGGGLTADFYVDRYLYMTLGLRGTVSRDISGYGLTGSGQMRNVLMGVNFGLNFALTR